MGASLASLSMFLVFLKHALFAYPGNILSHHLGSALRNSLYKSLSVDSL